MNRYRILPIVILLISTGLLAQERTLPASGQSTEMGIKGHLLVKQEPIASALSSALFDLQNVKSELPIARLSEIAQRSIRDHPASTRSAKDAQIYRSISPSVVLVVTKEGLGSGSLISASGLVVTNLHVVKGYSYVAVVFKPLIEGATPSRDEIKRGEVIKWDEVADLALIQVTEVPSGRNPIRLGGPEEIAIGADVHAIGHPTGDTWTYTKGVISQYRLGFEWGNRGEDIRHKADIIQTQTPINPGNSGGPLISDAGDLIGVNSFKQEGEGLNFAVSIDDVKRFLARQGNRTALPIKVAKSQGECKPKELSRFRNKENNATIIAFDMFCTGKDTGEYVIPDNKTEAIFLRVDRNGDGKADVIYFDLKRRGKWDISWWDENYDGHWTLVGYHDDGSLTPSRFESFAAYQRRLASR